MVEQRFIVGDLLRIDRREVFGVIFRVESVYGSGEIGANGNRFVNVAPVFGLFSAEKKISNRVIDADSDDVVLVRLEDLGAEFLAFTQFIQNTSR